jgi:hypothetical protein
MAVPAKKRTHGEQPHDKIGGAVNSKKKEHGISARVSSGGKAHRETVVQEKRFHPRKEQTKTDRGSKDFCRPHVRLTPVVSVFHSEHKFCGYQ